MLILYVFALDSVWAPGSNGLLLRRKGNYARANSWNLVNGVRIEQKEGLSHDKCKFVKAQTALFWISGPFRMISLRFEMSKWICGSTEVGKTQDVWRSGSLPDSETREVFKMESWPIKVPAFRPIEVISSCI